MYDDEFEADYGELQPDQCRGWTYTEGGYLARCEAVRAENSHLCGPCQEREIASKSSDAVSDVIISSEGVTDISALQKIKRAIETTPTVSNELQALLPMIAEEASELAVSALHCMRGRSDIISLLGELIDVIGYFELMVRRASPAVADELRNTIYTAVATHQFKLQERSLDPRRLELTYAFLFQLRALMAR